MLKIAHRGASGYAAENTIAAFARALEMGADAIELDVHVAKTGEIMVIHDATVERTTGGHGRVADKSLEALKELRTADNQTIPTLKETLDFVNNRAVIFIEVKVSGIAKELGQLIESEIHSGKWSREKLIVISFDHDELRELRNHFPKILIGASFDKIVSWKDAYAKLADFSPECLVVFVDEADGHLVKEIHSAGMKIHVWTANTPERIEYAKLLKVDGIMSDYPDRL